jgi:hypothetical protein
MKEMQSKIIGVTFSDEGVAFPNRQENVKRLTEGQKIFPLFEEDNPFDENAIKLFADPALQIPLGYVKREVAQAIGLQRKRGWDYWFYVKALTGEGKNTTGCNIRIVAERPA